MEILKVCIFEMCCVFFICFCWGTLFSYDFKTTCSG